METFLKIKIIALLCLAFNNCSQDRILVSDFVAKLGASSYDYYLFIPFDGCSDCVDKLILFTKENISNEKICFVIVTSSSRILLPVELTAASNCIIDNKIVSIREGWLSSNPVYYQRSGDQLLSFTIPADRIDYELYKLQKKLYQNENY